MPDLILSLGQTPVCPAAIEATTEQLALASVLLLAHDRQPVADVSGHPRRWADLALVRRALVCGVPVLGWGSGAALLGRALGAMVHTLAEDARHVSLHVSLFEQATSGDTHADDALLVGLVPRKLYLTREVTALPRTAQLLLGTPDCPVLFRAGSSIAYAGAQLPPLLLEHFLAQARLQTGRSPANTLEELGGEQALREVLRDFYARAREDELLGPVFARHVHDWNAHLERAVDFWVTALSGTPRYRGNLNVAHAHLGLHGEHLKRWLSLFEEACHAQLPREHSALLGARARVMGRALGAKKSREPLTES